MHNKQMNRFLLPLAATLVLSASGGVSAMTAQKLRSLLQDPAAEEVVVIDIRPRAAFARGHVPASLHIPVVGIEGRSIPPFGKVVVVGDGINSDVAARALGALNAKSGIEAELLDGGYPAWSASGGRTGGKPGLEPLYTPQISYDELLKVANEPKLVVVDLRGSDGGALTDLGALLPNARIVAPLRFERIEMDRSLNTRAGLDHQGVRKRGAPRWLQGQTLDESGLYVLVDAGDGLMSERVARRMTARGLKRVYTLTGGERILQSGGVFDVVTQTDSAVVSDD